MYSKDLERLVRTFVAQKLEREYILHYLLETYQLDRKSADELMAKMMPVQGKTGRLGKGAESNAAAPVRRQKFY